MKPQQNLASLLQHAVLLHQHGRTAEAELIYLDILRTQPRHFDCLYLLGMTHIQAGKREQAFDYFSKATLVNPSSFAAHNNLGNVLLELGREEQALASYNQTLALNPSFAPAHYNRGNVLRNMRRFEQALASYDMVLKLQPNHADAHQQRGYVLHQMGQSPEALQSYDRALSHAPDNPEIWCDRSCVLLSLHQPEQAAQSCQRALSLHPNSPHAHVNLGMALLALGQVGEALSNFDKALSIDPMSVMSHNSRGIALAKLNRLHEALDSFDKALQLQPQHLEALVNRGYLLIDLRRVEEALDHFESALQLSANTPYLLGAALHARMKLCQWDNLSQELERCEALVLQGAPAILPFPLLAVIDRPELHLQAARSYGLSKYPVNNKLGSLSPRPVNNKIRVGYYSADLREHAVSYLLAQLIEAHDRDRLEVYGFAFGPQSGDPMRQRMEQAFDHFLDVSALSDAQVAQLSREHHIDIAINLGGYTQHERTGVFALRCAPVQVSYLGYLGTMGVQYMDYILADKTVIPPDQRPHYTEQVVWLPHCFQVNDAHRSVSDRVFTRSELGLPEAGFVFCCFNANYKILPPTFASWMRVLTAVPGSVLWLIGDNPTACENLRAQAQRMGVQGSRLVFAERVPAQDYLARYRVADLFLDTLPYNAGTTASDALWVGVPVLTCMGQSFASRMAASLLQALGLPELITTSSQAYEEQAITLAKDAQRLGKLREKLRAKRQTSPLFDGQLFARHLEQAYEIMHKRALAGLPAEPIDLAR
jgi:predicted O-linked N-acetylglucosamine transferase (SPINDLY family)